MGHDIASMLLCLEGVPPISEAFFIETKCVSNA